MKHSNFIEHRYLRSVLMIGIAAALAGCGSTASVPVVSAEKSIELLQSKEVCCTSFSQISYEQVAEPGLYEYSLTGESEALELNSGKSFVKGIELPSDAFGDVKVKVTASIKETVFIPNVMLLDRNFTPVTSYGSHDIDYDSRSLFNGERFEREIVIDESHLRRGEAAYLLVYTTGKDLSDNTVLEQLDQGTIRVGRQNEPRMFGDLVVPHSALGNFTIRYRYTSTSDQGIAMTAAPEIAPVVAKEPVVQEVAIVEDTVSGIQPETEAMYIELIQRAVKDNQLDKALRFVEEGEKAGSTKLRDIFIDALKQGH